MRRIVIENFQNPPMRRHFVAETPDAVGAHLLRRAGEIGVHRRHVAESVMADDDVLILGVNENLGSKKTVKRKYRLRMRVKPVEISVADLRRDFNGDLV